MSNESIDLTKRYALYEGSGAASVVDAEAFWKQVYSGEMTDPKILVGQFEYEKDWNIWEMHPNGDELVIVVQGKIELLYEQKDLTIQSIVLTAGETFMVPKGLWHSAKVHEKAKAIHVTPGWGTENRSVR